MTTFILNNRTKHLSAQAVMDIVTLRNDMRTAKALEKRFPGSSFLDRIAYNVSKNLVGTGYNIIPTGILGLKSL